MTPLSEDSDGVAMPPPRRQGWVTAAVVGGVASVVLLAVVATATLSGKKPAVASTNGSRQLSQIIVQPPREECAKSDQNCLSQRCCQVTGYTCYEVHSGYAKCMKACTPGVDGTCLTQAVTAVARKSDITYSTTNLFCFSFYTQNTGSTKKSYELELLRTNLFLGTHIFGCESYRVFSDVQTWLSPGKVETVKIEDVEGNFHFAKRKRTGTWINSNIYIQTWKKIREEQMWSSKDWTVKLDADAVFLPQRLREKLGTIEVTDTGIYLENCKYVNFGFFGNLEVISRKGFGTFLENIEDCKSSLNYLGREKDYGNEPWGEDLFMQRCMDLHKVNRVSAWDITVDGMCQSYRPEAEKKNKKWKPNCAFVQAAAMHPFMKPNDYFECLKATQGLP
jgi:hypothetical protein